MSSSISDLSLTLALAPRAGECLALLRLTSFYCKFLRQGAGVADVGRRQREALNVCYFYFYSWVFSLMVSSTHIWQKRNFILLRFHSIRYRKTQVDTLLCHKKESKLPSSTCYCKAKYGICYFAKWFQGHYTEFNMCYLTSAKINSKHHSQRENSTGYDKCYLSHPYRVGLYQLSTYTCQHCMFLEFTRAIIVKRQTIIRVTLRGNHFPWQPFAKTECNWWVAHF